MWPALRNGDLVRGRWATDTDSLRPGDIVAIPLLHKREFLVHRLLGLVQPSDGLVPLIRTAGDNSGRDALHPMPDRLVRVNGVLRSGRWIPVGNSVIYSAFTLLMNDIEISRDGLANILNFFRMKTVIRLVERWSRTCG